MVYYDLRVERQNIFGSEKISIAADANKTVAFRIHFDAGWRVYDQKAAIFKNLKGQYYIIEIKGSEVRVPWEVLTDIGELEMSVIGFDNEKVLTAGKVSLSVVSSLLPEEYKLFSPSETLFDRFMAESIEAAYRKYKTEISELKRDYEKQLLVLGEKINEANESTKAVELAKNNELKELEQQRASQVNKLNLKLAELNSELAVAKADAEKWELVNTAIADKKIATMPLWNGGSKEYKLPMLNTKSIQSFLNSNFDGWCTEIGLNLNSITDMRTVFSEKKKLKKITLVNTGGVTSFTETFSGCTALREVILDGVKSCKNFNSTFMGCTSLERVVCGEFGFTNIFRYMFNGCISLKTIDGVLDFSAVRDVSGMFTNCTSLREVRFVPGSISVDMGMSNCNSLSKESMQSLFDGLAEVESKSLILSNYAFENNYPTAEEKNKIRTALKEKGWAISLT